MSDDILFDNFLVTDSKEAADDWAAQSWEVKIQQELASSGGVSGSRQTHKLISASTR